ncbi:histidine kinase [Kribbella flavida DSM 17836]|uniref:histidine kinase n=1 Tax=Kribbella flavida (strain DSM 17836 / JCM 10339 / NBRC 14399) TaxID=479435 RepID=D2PYM1_KRIFD|nr:HAMP domain-containing sensor histidine kinase [Kribbella flavida]ADB29867.1 histidine kinase [Kribbella flavida DSM 17836]
MRGRSVERLRRLRWRLTVLFTVMNTLGLVVLAPLLIVLNGTRTDDRVNHELDLVTEAMVRLIRDDNTLGLDQLSRDPLYDRCPSFVVLPGGATSFPPSHSGRVCAPVDQAVLDQVATEAVSSGNRVRADREATNGRDVRMLALPFKDSSQRYAGAVVAWDDTADEAAQHRNLVLTVLASCAVLIAAAALLGYWLSGRAIRPAMAALEQQEGLLADTAHDLRTPVAALRALAEAAAQDPEQRAELLPRTVRLAGRMGDIIDGLLVRARLAAGVEQLSMQLVWLDQLVAGVVEDTPAGSAQVSVVTVPTMVRADPSLVMRAIGNLFSNALRHGRGPNGQAVVTVTVADGRVTVADQGPGVDLARGEEMFERFHSGGGSSGLGLSIVRWVALSHGGDLKVYNGEEGGAIFEFSLPVAAPPDGADR